MRKHLNERSGVPGVGAAVLTIGLLVAACEAAPPQPDLEPQTEETLPAEIPIAEFQPDDSIEEQSDEPVQEPEDALRTALTELRSATQDPAAPCEAPEPDGAPASDPSPQRPTFTPYHSAPVVRNRAEAQQALVMEVHSVFRDTGVGGTVMLDFYISEVGIVDDVLISETSGYEQLDQAALRVAPVFEFCPALLDERPVAVWIQAPITFGDSQGA